MRPNPYAYVGQPVSESRFIGRAPECQRLRDRLYGSEEFCASSALVGLPRTGKTSIARRVLAEVPRSLGEVACIPVEINCGIFRSPRDLFRQICLDVVRTWAQRGGASAEALRLSVELGQLEDDLAWKRAVQQFFEECHARRVRAICLLDEFDSARFLFEGQGDFLHLVRTLAGSTAYGVGLLLASKRRLPEIAHAAGLSTGYWANVLDVVPVSVFSEVEHTLHCNRARSEGLELDGHCAAVIQRYCGRHPFLLDRAAYTLWAMRAAGDVDTEELERRLRIDAVRLFQEVAEILEDSGDLSKALQVFCGPTFDLKPQNISELEEHGVIVSAWRTGTSGVVESICPAFVDFLNALGHQVPFWGLWAQTERMLRTAIQERLEHLWQADWRQQVLRRRPGLTAMLVEAEARRNREAPFLGGASQARILDYTYPLDLFELLNADWTNLGDPLLGGDAGQWRRDFGQLARVRTPAAHNRLELLADSDISKARGVCERLLELLAPL